MDGVNWVDQGEFAFNPDTNDGQTFPMNNYPTARYFKYEASRGRMHGHSWRKLKRMEKSNNKIERIENA